MEREVREVLEAADHADKTGFPDVAEDIRSMKVDSQAPDDAV